jgi:hypothetical protein
MKVRVGDIRRVVRESVGFYEVEIDPMIAGDPKTLRSAPQLAYAVNTTNMDILVSRSGHGKLMRGRDKHDYEGGWIFPKQGKITFYSGTLGRVYDEQGVRQAIVQALGFPLRPTEDNEPIEEAAHVLRRKLNSVYDAEYTELVQFARAFESLGQEGQRQLKMLMDGDWEEMDPDAVTAIKDTIGMMSDEIDSAIMAYENEMSEWNEEIAA